MKGIIIKALGQTVEHDGNVILVSKDMPVNCMVLFVDMTTWQTIKDKVVLEHNEGENEDYRKA